MRYQNTTTTRPYAGIVHGDDFDRTVDRARREVDAEFLARTHHAGDVRHVLNPPLEVEEALNPELDWGSWNGPATR